MQTLTREQAIKRIRDIVSAKQVGHLKGGTLEQSYDYCTGAIKELVAIFDIKEEEL